MPPTLPSGAGMGGPGFGFAGSDALQKFARDIVLLNRSIAEMNTQSGIPRFASALSVFAREIDAYAARIVLPLKLIGEGLAGLAGAAAKLSGASLGWKALTQAPSAAIGAAGGIGQAAISPLTGPINAIGQVGNALGQMTAKANPATFIRFNMALDDAQAVLGRALSPAMEGLTELMRTLGDAIATNEESFKVLGEAMKKVFQALKPVITAVVDVAAKIAENLAPVLEFLANVISNVVGFISKTLKWLDEQGKQTTAHILQYWADFYERLGDSKEAARYQAMLLDLLREREKPQRSSVGAAVRSASMISGEDIGRRIFQAAFMGGQQSKEDKKIATLDQIKENLALIYQQIKAIVPGNVGMALDALQQVVGAKLNFDQAAAVEPEMP